MVSHKCTEQKKTNSELVGKKSSYLDVMLCVIVALLLFPWRIIYFDSPQLFCLIDSVLMGAVCGILSYIALERSIKINIIMQTVYLTISIAMYLLPYAGVHISYKFEKYVFFLYLIPFVILTLQRKVLKSIKVKINSMLLSLVAVLQTYILFAMIETFTEGTAFLRYLCSFGDGILEYLLMELVIGVFVCILLDSICKHTKPSIRQEETDVLS